ncbi:MAG: RimK family alpha-L-glutamate ligase [Candidatus Binatia bacterium]
MSQLFGITRERVFSPGKVEDDSAILEAAAAHLRERGHTVTMFRADEPDWPDPTGVSLVFTMGQGAAALARLQQWKLQGVRIINSPDGILNCQRHRTIAAFARAKIPFPESVLVETSDRTVLPEWVTQGAWVKRGDVHATEAGDVVRIDSRAAARDALQQLQQRGIRTALVQRHVSGMVLKFYGVWRRFFHCVPALDRPALPADVLAQVEVLGRRAAQALDVEIYGGDCVYDANGGLLLIDLNDWPSYASCRAEAAIEIAAYLHAREAAT